MSSFSIVTITAACALGLLACAGDGDVSDGGTGGSRGGAGGSAGGAGGSAGGAGGSVGGGASGAGGRGGATTGGGGTMGRGGRGGAGSGGAGGSVWDCLDVPGTLCICYMRADTGAPTCSAGFRCCFLLNATSCECFVAEEDCAAAATQYTQVASCPPP